MNTDPRLSARPCGCDPGANHRCERHEGEDMTTGAFDINRVDAVVADRLVVEGWVPVQGEPAKVLSSISHGMSINMICERVHAANKRWWEDLHTGEPINRNVGELLCLVHSEISEAMEGHRKNLQDDKLPHRKMIEVELADAIIRIFDIAAGLKLDLGGAFEEKMEYNRTRADHTREHRLAEGGKKY